MDIAQICDKDERCCTANLREAIRSSEINFGKTNHEMGKITSGRGLIINK